MFRVEQKQGMGDTRISVSLILGGSKKSTVTTLPTDSPLCEVVHRIKTSILADIHHFHFSSGKIHEKRSDAELSLSIYDCTLNPPRDMTSIVNQYHSPTGPNSITLQTLNWFPSAKLVIFSSEDEEARMSVLSSSINTDEDFQYNLPAKSTTSGIQITKGVKLSSEIANRYDAKLLPSEVFQAVADSRFDAQENDTSAYISHDVSKVASKPIKIRTEEERRAKIDARLKIIDEKSKQSKTSAQVKRMLIKSRAEGDKKIRMEDRFYLETVVMDDSNDNDSVDQFSEQDSTHRFYGRSNNIGRIVSSATKNLNLGSDRMAELLVIDKNGEDGACCSFRRLPNTTPIYEVERGGQLNSFDRVVIRIHNRLEETSNAVDGAKNLGGAKDESSSENNKDNVGIYSEEGSNTGTIQRSLFTNIAHAIEKLENENKKKRKAVLNEKVRHILLKGKAKGNKKIPETQRFYLEVVLLNKQFDVTIHPVFLSVYDPIHLLSKYISQVNCNSFTILIQGTNADKNCSGEATYSEISTDKRCIDLKDEGLLAHFKRIILVINE